MAAINEDLILKVFEEMVKNRPSLSKYIPEKDEDEETDYRIIANLVAPAELYYALSYRWRSNCTYKRHDDWVHSHAHNSQFYSINSL
jgi:hypothetical protein